MEIPSFVVVATLLFVVLPREAHGHGLLWDPMGRQADDYFVNRNYDVTGGGRGGGIGMTSDNGNVKWPYSKHQLCGDSYSTNTFVNPRKITRTYTAGGAANFGVLLWNQHGGRWNFRLCKKGATTEKQCVDMRRADGKGKYFYPPIDANDPTMQKMWSVYGPSLNIAPWMGTGPSKNFSVKRVKNRADGMNQFINSPVVYTRWVIPKNFCIGQCIIQWYWLTGNSCMPPCSKEDPIYPNCRSKCTRPNCFCTDPGAAYPEEFWNCADVKIVKPKAKKGL